MISVAKCHWKKLLFSRVVFSDFCCIFSAAVGKYMIVSVSGHIAERLRYPYHCRMMQGRNRKVTFLSSFNSRCRRIVPDGEICCKHRMLNCRGCFLPAGQWRLPGSGQSRNRRRYFYMSRCLLRYWRGQDLISVI